MRKIISWEGEEKVPGVILEKDSLLWPEEKLPVVWNFDFENLDSLLGHASDLRREEDGSVTAEIVFNTTKNGEHARVLSERGEISFTTWTNELVEKKVDTKRKVVRARIRSVAAVLTDSVGWD